MGYGKRMMQVGGGYRSTKKGGDKNSSQSRSQGWCKRINSRINRREARRDPECARIKDRYWG